MTPDQYNHKETQNGAVSHTQTEIHWKTNCNDKETKTV